MSTDDKIAEYVARVVATATPLTPIQREVITAAFVGFDPAERLATSAEMDDSMSDLTEVIEDGEGA